MFFRLLSKVTCWLWLSLAWTSGSFAEELYKLSANEEAFFALVREHPEQARGVLLLDPRLCAAARSHALDMVTRGFYSHVSPEGIGPNERAKRAGFPLPNWYHQHLDANNIESYYYGSGSWNSPEKAFHWFMNSPMHKPQILAGSSFAAAQTMVGIGFAVNPRTGVGGFVFLSSHPFPLASKPGTGHLAPSIAISPQFTLTFNNTAVSELYNFQTSDDGLHWTTVGAFIAGNELPVIRLEDELLQDKWFARILALVR